MGFKPDKLNTKTFIGALLSSIGGMYMPPRQPHGVTVKYALRSVPRSKRPVAILHPTNGWKGPGTVTRGTNRRRGVEFGALKIYPRVNPKKERARKLHCANVMREQAADLEKILKRQECFMGVSDPRLEGRRDALLARAESL